MVDSWNGGYLQWWIAGMVDTCNGVQLVDSWNGGYLQWRTTGGYLEWWIVGTKPAKVKIVMELIIEFTSNQDICSGLLQTRTSVLLYMFFHVMRCSSITTVGTINKFVHTMSTCDACH
jgi:hypothetical protein